MASLTCVPTEIRLRIFSYAIPSLVEAHCQCHFDHRRGCIDKSIRYKTGGIFIEFIRPTRDQNPRICYPLIQNSVLPYLLINKQISTELLDPRSTLKPQVSFTFCDRKCLHSWLAKVPRLQKRAVNKIRPRGCHAKMSPWRF